MKSYRVHRAHFYKPEAHAIHCFSYDEDSFNLAVSRSDNSIEIWDLRYAPYQKQVYPCYQGYSVEALAWCGNRLFSSGLSAYILEHTAFSLLPRNSTPSNGGPVWCLAFSKDKQFLAAGTEDGYISLFRVTDDGIEFERNFDNQEGRILCLAWHNDGQTIASGSTDIIRLWNVANGYAVDRILVGRVHQKAETTVWCLAFLTNGTIVSGDSWGRTSFWDSKTGTLIRESRDHKADVLALCVSKDETSVFASGVDPIIIQYTQACLQPYKSAEIVWVKSEQLFVHSHDVRALIIAGPYLISGGVDSCLTFNNYSPKSTFKFPPLQQSGVIHLAPKSRCLLLQYSKILEIWHLGDSEELNNPGDGDLMPLTKNVQRILKLCPKEGETIVCSAISADMRWLAYSTLECLRQFYFTMEADDLHSQIPNVTLQKVKHLPPECRSATCLCFTATGNKLVVANGAKICVLGTNLVHPTLLHSFNTDSASFVRHLRSNQSEYVAAASLNGKITVFNLEDYSVLCSLPHHHCAATAMEFHPLTGNLFAVYADHKVVEYDVSSKAYDSWTRKLSQMSKGFLNAHLPVLGISFDEGNAVILHDDSTVYSIRIDELAPSDAKRFRPHEKKQMITAHDVVVTTSTRYKHLLAFLHLEKDEMVAVEVLPITVTKQLPPALRRKKFGI